MSGRLCDNFPLFLPLADRLIVHLVVYLTLNYLWFRFGRSPSLPDHQRTINTYTMSDPIKAVVVDEEDQQQPVVDSPAGRVSSASAVGEETPVPASEAIEELAPSRQLQADTVKASAQADTESTAPEAVPTGSLIDFDAPVESVITPAFSRPDVVSSSSAVIVPHLLSPSKTPILLPSANTTSLSQAPPPSPCDMSSTSSTLPSDTTTDPFGELSERDLTGISRAFPAPSSPKTSSPSQTHLQILAQLDQEVAKLGEDVDKLDLEQKAGFL